VQYLVAQQLAAGGAGSRRGRVGRVGRREGRRCDRHGATLGADLQRGTTGISLTQFQPALLFSQSTHTYTQAVPVEGSCFDGSADGQHAATRKQETHIDVGGIVVDVAAAGRVVVPAVVCCSMKKKGSDEESYLSRALGVSNLGLGGKTHMAVNPASAVQGRYVKYEVFGSRLKAEQQAGSPPRVAWLPLRTCVSCSSPATIEGPSAVIGPGMLPRLATDCCGARNNI